MKDIDITLALIFGTLTFFLDFFAGGAVSITYDKVKDIYRFCQGHSLSLEECHEITKIIKE
jgi:hypothetical protein